MSVWLSAGRLLDVGSALVDTELTVTIDVQPDSSATVAYVHEILNLTSDDLTRLSRDVWFEHVDGQLRLDACPVYARPRLSTRRLHDTANSCQFAIDFDPPVLPGEAARFRYAWRGPCFVEDHYWRQSLPRHARYLTIQVRHHGSTATTCSAVEGLPNGEEARLDDAIVVDSDPSGTRFTFTRDYLRPGQFVTLFWESARGPAA